MDETLKAMFLAAVTSLYSAVKEAKLAGFSEERIEEELCIAKLKVEEIHGKF